MTPSIGRIVHYRDDDYPGDESDENWIAGIIVHVTNSTTVCLMTWDRFGVERYRDQVEMGTALHNWRWPPRVE